MFRARVVLVGGFLGAGKTTLLAEAAVRLTRQGKRVGLVANDQAADLVDTALLKQTGASVEEVAGGCFCCRFSDMVAAMERLARDSNVEILLGEPVGSCTDLSATVMQPIKDRHRERFQPAPLSVLVDAAQVRTLARLHAAQTSMPQAPFPDEVLYIYRKQIEEADAIVVNKADLLAPYELHQLRQSLADRFPDKPILAISALTGEGVDAWLELVSRGEAAGTKIAEVDYDTYAAGEAALGWMNASAKLQAHQDLQWDRFATELLEAIRTGLRQHSAEIAHLKVFFTSPAGWVAGNITGSHIPTFVRGQIQPEQRTVSLLINARVHVAPELLRGIVEAALGRVAGDQVLANITTMRSFFPTAPQPTYRYQKPV